MPENVRKLVLPVAGLGTRNLPATKAIPKEMLPVVDKPLIQYAIDEGLEAGIEHFIFVTGRGKGAIEDYFDRAYELEATLAAKDKKAELEILEASTPQPGSMSFIRQQTPHGLGHAVWCARDIVGDEPFAVLLPDDLVLAERGCLAQLISVFEETAGNVVAIQDVPREHTSRYGVLDPGAQTGRLVEVKGLVEKPSPADAPSTLTTIGRYVLLPEIFEPLGRGERGAGGEIQLTDAMARLIGRAPFHGYLFEGERHDCGNKLGILTANIAYGLRRPDLGPDLRQALEELLNGDR